MATTVQRLHLARRGEAVGAGWLGGPVFGREREIAVGDSLLEAARERFSVLLFGGEAGIGKTTVWREVGRAAEAQGFRVLSCRPAESETKLALSAVADLVENVPRAVYETLPAPQRRALDVALLRIDSAGRDTDPRTLATGVRSLLAALSADGPLLVAIDDEQWLDAASARVLEYALRRLGDRPIGWLFARRNSAEGRSIVDALPSESVTRASIGPLTLAAIHHVIKGRLGRSLNRPLLVRVHQTSGGNPLYALEIARAAELTGPNHMGWVPSDVRTLVARRLGHLPPATRDALLTAAALSEPTTSSVDEAALGPAEEADLVSIDGDGGIAFRHPLYASAVYEGASQARRRRLHRRLAQRATDPEERARHLAVATVEPDGAVARLLEEGAALARSRGVWESAATLLERAARLTPPQRLREAEQLGVAAAEHHVHAGDRARARVLLEELLGRPLARPTRAQALRILAEISYNDDNFLQASHHFRNALQVADDPRHVVEILLGLSYVEAQMWDQLWDFPGAATHARRALELAEGLGDDALVAEALGYCAMLDFLCGRGLDRASITRAVELEDPNRLVPVERRPSAMAALLSLYDGGHAEARKGLNTVCSAARRRGDESDLAFALTWQSWLETRAGNFDAARTIGEEAASLANLTGSRSMHAWSLSQQAYVHAHRGDVVNTRLRCSEAADLLESSGYLQPGMWIAASLTLLELSLGNPDAAWEACEPLVGALESSGVGEPVVAFIVPDALEALITLGQLDRAEALLASFEARADKLGRLWAQATAARARGLLLAARGNLPGSLLAMEQALDTHDGIDMPFDHARALLVVGAIERRAGRRRRARTSLERALSEFQRLGSPLWAKRTRSEISRLGLRRSSGRELTVSERRVAELAAAGLTNREVAAALFVSAKTVEANLARVYRKFGIRSRAQLGARMSATAQR